MFSVGSLDNTGAVEDVTTWNDQPPVMKNKAWPTTITVQLGNYYSLCIGKGTPGPGSVTMSSVDSCFTWFQDLNPCAIGPFLTFDGDNQA